MDTIVHREPRRGLFVERCEPDIAEMKRRVG
jgi:hypothetical protein